MRVHTSVFVHSLYTETAHVQISLITVVRMCLGVYICMYICACVCTRFLNSIILRLYLASSTLRSFYSH